MALHNLTNDDGTTVELTRVRDGRSETKTLKLAKGWKTTDFSWRGSRWSLKPQPGFWAPPLTDEQRPKLGTPSPPASSR